MHEAAHPGLQPQPGGLHDGGDHEIVLGRVRALEAPGLDSGSPLVYYGSRYRALAG